jgi:hypothetical protein
MRAGLVRRCEADALNLASAAARALRVGRSNPAGLFASIVRARAWHLATLADEDRARRAVPTLMGHASGREPDARRHPKRDRTVLPIPGEVARCIYRIDSRCAMIVRSSQ